MLSGRCGRRSGRTCKIVCAEEAETTATGKEGLLAKPLWSLRIVSDVAPVHFDALGNERVAQINSPFEPALAFGVLFPWIVGSVGGSGGVQANNPHADDGGVDGVEGNAEVVSVGLETDIVVGHGPVGSVDSSHSADVLGNDLMGAHRHSLVQRPTGGSGGHREGRPCSCAAHQPACDPSR
jgi:hypothetical protein